MADMQGVVVSKETVGRGCLCTAALLRSETLCSRVSARQGLALRGWFVGACLFSSIHMFRPKPSERSG